MPTGRPHYHKCPKCKRGKYGEARVYKGCQVIGHEVKDPRDTNGKHRTIVKCFDCGHVWRSTIREIWVWKERKATDRAR